MGRVVRLASTRVWSGLICVAALLLTAACTGNSGADNGNGYVSGDGTVDTIAQSDRRDPIDATGTTLDGDPIDLADYRGKVVVINVWGQWCAECHLEQAGLVDAAKRSEDATFLGIDTRDDSISSARGYVDKYDIPYPSFYDPDGTVLLAFHDALPPTAIPSTLVLDPEGRVAARVLGVVTARTVEGLVDDVAAEGS